MQEYIHAKLTPASKKALIWPGQGRPSDPGFPICFYPLATLSMAGVTLDFRWVAMTLIFAQSGQVR